MSKSPTSKKKYISPILDTIVSILCLIIIYESLFVEKHFWRVVVFSFLLIFNIADVIKFWKNKSK